mmetsp:Transcript_21884/g.28324  ORF Transcript_21884/g.28324 Transcript_21884/m.28324 type:complete len:286 (+) Transcript_21884:66-923(+)
MFHKNPVALLLHFALVVVKQHLSTETAVQILDEQILPVHEYNQRSNLNENDVLAAQAQGQVDRAMAGNDPLLQYTYAEFPLLSLDMCLNQAVPAVIENINKDNQSKMVVVDLGSGCGRPSLYMALTRPNFKHVIGIEASQTLHQEGLRSIQAATDLGLLGVVANEVERVDVDNNNLEGTTDINSNALTLHCGMAQEYAYILNTADLVFCYSTAFESSGVFLPEIRGLILSNEWNELLSKHCRPGTVVITTDRALDPARGWRVLQRMDSVPNPQVVDSTCFIQQRI